VSTLLNWIDTMFFGVRRILTGGVELPDRPALNFEGARVVDNPAKNRIDVSFPGVQQDDAEGLVVGTATGGWVTVRSDRSGFRVTSKDGSGFAFVVDNGAAEVRVGYALQLAGPVQLGDVDAPAAPASGVSLASVRGAFRVTQHAPPKVTGSRADPQAALKNLLTALANAGLIVDQTVA
jgi:hypothetical protein